MFTSYRDLTNRSDCLFYLLDENEIIYPDNEIQKILQIFPVFQDIKNDMKNIYKKHFNKMVSHKLQNVILSKFANNTKKLIVNPNKELEEKAKEIFLIIQNRIKLNLIDLLPKLPILISKDVKL